MTAKAEESRTASNNARLAAVAALKASASEVAAAAAAKAALAKQLAKQKRQMQDKEFQALVEAGQNPYEMYRRRDNAAEVRIGDTHRVYWRCG